MRSPVICPVHEFKARWPDGTVAARRVFVPQVEITFNIDYKMSASDSGGHGKFSGKPDVKKTVIVL